MKKFSINRPQYGLGSWLGKNGAVVGDIGGAALGITAAALGAPEIAPALMKAGSSLGNAEEQKYNSTQNNNAMQNQARINALTEYGATQIKPQYNYMQPMARGGKLYPNGGAMVNYTGQRHEGKDGGISVDAQGNPTVTTGEKPVGLVEGGEVSYKTNDGQVFVFSDRLGYAKQAKRIMGKYKHSDTDAIEKRGMDKELGRLADEQEQFKADMAAHEQQAQQGQQQIGDEEQQPEQTDENTENMETMANGGDISQDKAKQMLKDNSAQGHALTDKQKKYFGWIAGDRKAMGGDLEEPPAEKPINNAVNGLGDEEANVINQLKQKYGDIYNKFIKPGKIDQIPDPVMYENFRNDLYDARKKYPLIDQKFSISDDKGNKSFDTNSMFNSLSFSNTASGTGILKSKADGGYMPKYWGGGEVKRNIYDKLGADYHVPQKQEFMRYANGGYTVTNPNDAYNGMMPNYDGGGNVMLGYGFANGGRVPNYQKNQIYKILDNPENINNYAMGGNVDLDGYNNGSGASVQYNHQYSKGGTIHIKPENKGKFTAYKERTGKTTEEALHSKDPHVRQMANFARNAAKWKHADGGNLNKWDDGGYMPKYWGGGEVKRNIYDKLGADYHVPQKQEFMRYAPGGHIVTNPNDAYNGMMPNYDSGNFVGEDTVSDTAPITTDATSANNYTLTGNGGSNTQPTGSKFTGNYNYMIPAAQIAGDVGMLAMQRKMQPQPITAPPITPQQINLAPQRAQIQAQGMAAQRSNQMAMRNAGLNPVQYMSAVGAGNADVNRNTNEALLQSGLAEQQYNVGTANQFAGINAQRKTQADMYNAQMKNYYNQQRLGLMSDIAAVPARGMSNAQDIRQRTMSAEMNNPYYNVTNSPNNNLWTTLTGNNQYNLQVSPYGQNFSRGNGGTLGEYQKYIQSYNPYNKKCIGGQLGRGGKLKQIMVTR